MISFLWIRLINVAVEIAATVLLVPSTIILAHYGGRFRYLFISLLWSSLVSFSFVTIYRIGKAIPVDETTAITTLLTMIVLICAVSIVTWYMYMAHHDRLPRRTPVRA